MNKNALFQGDTFVILIVYEDGTTDEITSPDFVVPLDHQDVRRSVEDHVGDVILDGLCQRFDKPVLSMTVLKEMSK